MQYELIGLLGRIVFYHVRKKAPFLSAAAHRDEWRGKNTLRGVGKSPPELSNVVYVKSVV